MTTVEKTYQKYLLKVEKNGTNDNSATDRGKFVLLFNESQNKFTERVLQNRGIDDVRYIQHLLKLDVPISHSSKTQEHYNFSLPKDYFDSADVRAKAKKEKCEDMLFLFEVKTENLNNVMNDEYQKPSFEWREAPYTVNSDTISVYTDNTFTVDKLLLNYYRYPNQIQLINPFDPESKFNEGKKIEWDDKALDIIISITAGEFDMNQNNPRFQLQNARTQK